MTVTLHAVPDLIQASDLVRFNKFAPKGNPDQCWEWRSIRNGCGYGGFRLGGKTVAAHRVSYEMHHGPIPAGLVVRHTCDNPPCVNPAHLLVGTRLDNARDAVERGRYRRGAAHGRAKLTAHQVSEIRQARRRGETQASLAARFGVSVSAVQRVLSGKTWAGIGEAS